MQCLFKYFGLQSFGIILLFLLFSAQARSLENSSESARIKPNRLTLEAVAQPLGQILEEIRLTNGVRFVGLEDRAEDMVTFTAKNEPIEKALKKLLRSLDENNYAFVYTRTRLKQVSVMPKAGNDPPRPNPADIAGTPADNEKAVRIIRINEGTQAANLDLKENDLIIEYDGVRIRSAQELVAAVKKKSPDEIVEMLVVRSRDPRRIVLNGGLIGVNIITVTVPLAELGL